MSLCAALLVSLAACPDEPEPETTPVDGSAKTPASSASAAPSATPSSAPKEVAIVARAKEQLDGKEPDASHSGQALAVEGAKASFTVLSDWTLGSAEVRTALSKDDKGRFAAIGHTDGDAKAKGEAAEKELKLTACRWSADEDITLGKDKLPTKVADGVCMRDKTVVRMIRAVVSDADANIVALGGWDDGADDAAVLDTFRSLKKGGGSIAACCDAISGNMASAPPNQKVGYAAALVFCRSVMASPEARQILAQVRGKLGGLSVPPACQ